MRQIRSFDTKQEYLADNTVLAPSIIYIRESGESRDVFEVAPPDSQLYTAVGVYNSENKLTTQILESFDNSYVLHSGYSGLVTFNEFKYFTGVTELWAGYFSLMSSYLEEITLPKSLTTIRGGAFIGCDLLDKLIIPDKVTVFESGALTGCTGLTELVLGNGITSLNDKMVDQVPNLMRLVIRNKALLGMSDTDDPSTFDYGKYPYFKGLQFVTDVVVDGYQLTSKQIEDLTITRKGYYFIPQKKPAVLVATFYYPSYNVNGSNIQITGGYADWKNNFSKVYTQYDERNLGDPGVSVIQFSASPGFSGSFYYELKDEKTIDVNSFRGCTCLTSVTIPSSVTSIGVGAFYYCESLTSVEIPDSVTRIEVNAFNGCSVMTSVTIGNSITSIGDNAFIGCDSLTSITCLATTPPTIGNGTFAYTGYCPIYVPSESVDTYKSSWSDLASRIQAIP